MDNHNYIQPDDIVRPSNLREIKSQAGFTTSPRVQFHSVAAVGAPCQPTASAGVPSRSSKSSCSGPCDVDRLRNQDSVEALLHYLTLPDASGGDVKQQQQQQRRSQCHQQQQQAARDVGVAMAPRPPPPLGHLQRALSQGSTPMRRSRNFRREESGEPGLHPPRQRPPASLSPSSPPTVAAAPVAWVKPVAVSALSAAAAAAPRSAAYPTAGCHKLFRPAEYERPANFAAAGFTPSAAAPGSAAAASADADDSDGGDVADGALQGSLCRTAVPAVPQSGFHHHHHRHRVTGYIFVGAEDDVGYRGCAASGGDGAGPADAEVSQPGPRAAAATATARRGPVRGGGALADITIPTVAPQRRQSSALRGDEGCFSEDVSEPPSGDPSLLLLMHPAPESFMAGISCALPEQLRGSPSACGGGTGPHLFDSSDENDDEGVDSTRASAGAGASDLDRGGGRAGGAAAASTNSLKTTSTAVAAAARAAAAEEEEEAARSAGPALVRRQSEHGNVRRGRRRDERRRASCWTIADDNGDDDGDDGSGGSSRDDASDAISNSSRGGPGDAGGSGFDNGAPLAPVAAPVGSAASAAATTAPPAASGGAAVALSRCISLSSGSLLYSVGGLLSPAAPPPAVALPPFATSRSSSICSSHSQTAAGPCQTLFGSMQDLPSLPWDKAKPTGGVGSSTPPPPPSPSPSPPVRALQPARSFHRRDVQSLLLPSSGSSSHSIFAAAATAGRAEDTTMANNKVWTGSAAGGGGCCIASGDGVRQRVSFEAAPAPPPSDTFVAARRAALTGWSRSSLRLTGEGEGGGRHRSSASSWISDGRISMLEDEEAVALPSPKALQTSPQQQQQQQQQYQMPALSPRVLKPLSSPAAAGSVGTAFGDVSARPPRRTPWMTADGDSSSGPSTDGEDEARASGIVREGARASAQVPAARGGDGGGGQTVPPPAGLRLPTLHHMLLSKSGAAVSPFPGGETGRWAVTRYVGRARSSSVLKIP